MEVKISIENSERICKKGNGRIFVQSEEDKEKVIEIIRNIDEEKFSNYMPEYFVEVIHPKYNRFCYTGKFDLDINKLRDECNKQGIKVLIVSCNDYNYDDELTLEKAIGNQIKMRYVSEFTL